MRVKRFLKLTGGSYMGRKLYVPDFGVRPATNLVREAIFSTLHSFFESGVYGLRVLDLFAGTGSLGLEAMSRGAANVTCVDRNLQSVKSIRKNMQLLDYTAEIVKSDVLIYLRRGRNLRYDLVFVDPPYRYKQCPEVIRRLVNALEPEYPALVVHERAFSEQLPDFGNTVMFLKRKKYGQTEILYYGINR
jgi:16S rRNA (guanine966-N2)-methyltransferase